MLGRIGFDQSHRGPIISIMAGMRHISQASQQTIDISLSTRGRLAEVVQALFQALGLAPSHGQMLLKNSAEVVVFDLFDTAFQHLSDAHLSGVGVLKRADQPVLRSIHLLTSSWNGSSR